MNKLVEIQKIEDMSANIQRAGMLPFFECGIPGHSIAEHTPRHLWFSDTQDGPWEWKGPAARRRDCIYGKFYGGKAGYVSLDLAADFLNYRRDGYDFDARYEDGLAARKDKEVYDILAEHGSLLTGALKRLGNYRKDGNKGFETVITRLQMQGYVLIADFEYRTGKDGRRSGWGIARYSTPEAIFGEEFIAKAYERTPEESKQRLLSALKERLPDLTEQQLLKLIG